MLQVSIVRTGHSFGHGALEDGNRSESKVMRRNRDDRPSSDPPPGSSSGRGDEGYPDCGEESRSDDSPEDRPRSDRYDDEARGEAPPGGSSDREAW